jgi:hypothetical protein
MWSARAVGKLDGLQVAPDPLVAGLAADAEAATELSHAVLLVHMRVNELLALLHG